MPTLPNPLRNRRILLTPYELRVFHAHRAVYFALGKTSIEMVKRCGSRSVYLIVRDDKGYTGFFERDISAYVKVYGGTYIVFYPSTLTTTTTPKRTTTTTPAPPTAKAKPRHRNLDDDWQA